MGGGLPKVSPATLRLIAVLYVGDLKQNLVDASVRMASGELVCSSEALPSLLHGFRRGGKPPLCRNCCEKRRSTLPDTAMWA